MNRIFIGYDSSQSIAYDVLLYSISKNISKTDTKVIPLRLEQIKSATGFDRILDPLQSTEFTYTRFLVPYLCDYKGTALFMDSDMLCLGDINELFNLDMSEYWLRCVKHTHIPTSEIKMTGKVQTKYPRKNWSSLMLIDCSKLTAWNVETVSTMPGSWLHRFQPIPDDKIGDIDPSWNELDTYGPGTKIIHYTEGGPWLPNYSDHKYGDIWRKYAKEYLYG